MVFHIGFICACLLTLASAFTVNQTRRIDNCGFELTATCEEKMTLTVDGTFKTSSDSWRQTRSVQIPANTRTIEISCRDGWIHGGIIASGDNGLKTDDTWSCSFDDGKTWSNAFTFGINGQTLPDISPDAEWIWTGMQTWKHGYNDRHTNAVCKIDLGSTCSTATTLSPSNSGFGLYATCYEKMTVFVDGLQMRKSADFDKWEETKKIHIPSDAKNLEIHCEHGWNARGGILASGDNGLITDGTWMCSNDDGATWNSAFEINPNSMKPSEISSRAKWIWNEKDACNSPGDNKNKKIICKTKLVSSANTPVQTLTDEEFIINSKYQQEHCCGGRDMGSDYYNIAGVLKEDSTVQKYGCLNNCVYNKNYQDSKRTVYCFSSSGSVCQTASDHFEEFNDEADKNREALDKFFEAKTQLYKYKRSFPSLSHHVTKYPLLEDKITWIKNDLKNDNINIEDRKLVRFNLPPVIDNYIGKIQNIFNKHILHNDLEDELNSLEDDLMHESHVDHDLHEVSHHLIEVTKLFSKMRKSEDNGGEDSMNKMWEALMANTEFKDRSSRKSFQVRDLSSCGSSLTNELGSATGCVGGPAACVMAVAPAHINSVISCGPVVLEGATQAIDAMGCFASTSLVETMSGVKEISDLVIGDFVRTSSPTGELRAHFTEFVGWLDRHKSSPVEMLQVFTAGANSTLTLTPSHIVFAGNDTKYADELLPGDFLMHWNGSHIVHQEVIEIRKTFETGFWAPLTRDGTLLVNGYLTSCYASFPHQISDMAMTPVKAMPKLLLENEESQHKDGVRSVVKLIKNVGEWIGVRKTKEMINPHLFSSIDRATQLNHFTAKSEL